MYLMACAYHAQLAVQDSVSYCDWHIMDFALLA